ncbi:MAG: hypothetical protein WDW36_005969 [Sanguina aurantia]
MGPALPTEEELNDFNDSVSEVSRLIQGLKEGTITPDYIKGKQERGELLHQKKEVAAAAAVVVPEIDKEQEAKDTADKDQKQERLIQKVEELKANRWRKLKARERYTAHLHEGEGALRFETDYAKWDMWCPSDDEDDLFNSIPPNTPQFRAMEKDIDQRHTRMIEQRQLAERQRMAGNTAFNTKQYSEALRCYETGIESQKSSMTLHANAALAALKMHCNVSAIEHCDKVLHIADVLHDTPNAPLCGKAYQRRACAYRSLQQPRKALADFEAAARICPTDPSLLKELATQRADVAELDKQKAISSALRRDDQTQALAVAGQPAAAPAAAAAAAAVLPAGGGEGREGRPLDLGKLRQVELLSQKLASSLTVVAVVEGVCSSSSSSSKDATGAAPQPSAGDSGGATAAGGAGGEASVPAVTPAVVEGAPAGGNLSKRNTGAAAAQAFGSTSALAQQLQLLLTSDDLCCVHFRQCGGLQTTVDQISSSSAGATGGCHAAALLQLLNACCTNDSNLQRLVALAVLPAVTRMLLGEGVEPAACAAAGVLLCTVVTLEAPRREVSRLLASDPGGVARLLDLMSGAAPTQQAVLLTLLGNCAVDVPCRQSLAATLLPQSTHVATLLQLLRSPHAEVAERAITLLSNACGDAEVRRRLQRLPELLEAILACALATLPRPNKPTSTTPADTASRGSATSAPTTSPTPTPTNSSSSSNPGGSTSSSSSSSMALSRAACTTLYNLCLEPSAQAAVAASTRLPDLVALLSDTTDTTRLGRVIGILSRVAKQPAGMAALVDLPCMEALVSILQLQPLSATATATAAAATVVTAAAVTDTPTATTAADAAAAAASQQALEITAKEACVRTLTLMLAAEGESGTEAQRLVRLGGARSLLGVLGMAGCSEAILGNAALCLGHVAKHAVHLPLLRGLDAVAPLVRVAYEGKGNTASKNAAIALARLAHDTVMMERLRDLHGLEIIYKYVKP